MKTKHKYIASTMIALLLVAGMVCAFPVAAMAATEDDTTASVTFTEGILELKQAPNLVFTTTALTGNNYTGITLASADKTVMVSDLRSAKSGWTLTASLSNFTAQTSATTDSLGASSIVVTGVTPTGGSAGIGASEKATCGASITLTCNASPQDVEVMKALNGAGFGIWEAELTSGNTVLNIATGLQPTPETHEAEMHWNLALGV